MIIHTSAVTKGQACREFARTFFNNTPCQMIFDNPNWESEYEIISEGKNWPDANSDAWRACEDMKFVIKEYHLHEVGEIGFVVIYNSKNGWLFLGFEPGQRPLDCFISLYDLLGFRWHDE